MDLVALSNGLHGSVQMDSVALFSWIGWLRHHGIFRVFNTEILISDFNEGMNIGMVQKNDSSFSFNSWRVEDSESNIMDMYRNQIVDLIDKIETFKDGALIHTKALTLKNTNLWRLSRLVKNYGVTIVESNDSNKIYFLSNYDDNDFAFAFEELKKENTK